MVFAGGRCR